MSIFINKATKLYLQQDKGIKEVEELNDLWYSAVWLFLFISALTGWYIEGYWWAIPVVLAAVCAMFMDFNRRVYIRMLEARDDYMERLNNDKDML